MSCLSTVHPGSEVIHRTPEWFSKLQIGRRGTEHINPVIEFPAKVRASIVPARAQSLATSGPFPSLRGSQQTPM
jgi:hypothetical protein